MRNTIVAAAVLTFSGAVAGSPLGVSISVGNVANVNLGDAPIPSGINHIVSFGDSLTDTGKVATLTKDNGPQIPSDLYWNGRFTNYYNWLDYVVESKNLTVENFAAGGATTSDALIQGWVGKKFGEPARNNDTVQDVPGVDTQIKSYTDGKNKAPRSQTLYTIFVGPNDFFDNGLLGLNKTANYFAAAQYNEWISLAKIGATKIMPMVLPSLLDQFYANYSSEIDRQIGLFKQDFPLVQISKYEVPITVFLSTTYVPPLNDSAPCCINCFSGSPTAVVCSSPDTYLSWDGLHPTSIVHKRIADDVANFVQSNFGWN